MSAAPAAPFAELRNRRGERLEFAFHPASMSSVAIVAHGVTSSFDRPYLVALGDALAREGVAALRFSFAGNGGSEGRFEDATLTKEVEDATSVVDALAAAGFTQIAWAGHSMGGAVGTMLAARDARVRALVSLAGMFHVAEFFRRHFAQLPFGAPMLGKTACPWSRALAEDAARIGSLQEAARRVKVPWLLLHGDADEMVPFSDSKDALLTGDPASVALRLLTKLGAADHRFSGAVPRLTGAAAPWLARIFQG